jgi:hypothetical protein
MDELIKRVLNGGLIDVGEVSITKTRFRDDFRYLVYLPMTRNYLWEIIYSLKCKVRLFIQVVGEQRCQSPGCSKNG